MHCRVIGVLDLSKLLRLQSPFDRPPPSPASGTPGEGEPDRSGGLRCGIPPGATGAAVGAGIESAGFPAGVSTLVGGGRISAVCDAAGSTLSCVRERWRVSNLS